MNKIPEIQVTNTESRLPKGAWLLVVMLALGGCLNYLDRIMITTMRVSILQDIPMTEAQFGLLTSSFLWVYGVISPIAGFLADRISKSKMIIGSVFLWSAVTWMTGYSTNFGELLTTRILMGVSEAAFIPAALSLIMDYHQHSTRSRATGLMMVGIMVGSGFGFIGGWVAERQHWSAVFIWMGVLGILFSILLAFTVKDLAGIREKSNEGNVDRKTGFIHTITALFRMRSYVFIFIAWGLFGIVGWLVVGWLPTFFLEKFHLSEGIAGLYATGYYYPAALVGLLLGGYWADRWSKTNPRARIWVQVIGIAIAAPSIFIASEVNILFLAVALFMAFALTKSFIDTNMMPALCLVVNPDDRATAYGILNFLSCIIGGAGLYAGGVLRDMQVSLTTIYQAAALTMVAGMILLALVKPVNNLLEEE